MLKKILLIGLVIIAAYIMLPFGFAAWNERIGVGGQITIADLDSSPSDMGEEAISEAGDCPDEEPEAVQTDPEDETAIPEESEDAGEETFYPEPESEEMTGEESVEDSGSSQDSEEKAASNLEKPEDTGEEIGCPEPTAEEDAGE